MLFGRQTEAVMTEIGEYEDWDATECAERLRRGDVSEAELLASARAQLEAQNAELNAVIHRFELPRRGSEDAPFAGVPFLFKDDIDIEGTPVSLGSKLLSGFTCERSHPFVEAARDLGFVTLGRTNMPELGLVPTTEPRAHGPTRNPWSLKHSPGGSSGGAGAALASGMVPIAHGSDGGGSIRVPASACGLVGLKPSRGRMPAAVNDPPPAFVTHGCLTRTVRDSRLFLTEMRARTGRSMGSAVPPLPAGPERALRIAVSYDGLLGHEPHPDVRRSVDSAVTLLVELGHSVEVVSPPVDTRGFADAYRVLWATAAGVFLDVAQRAIMERAPPWSHGVLGRSEVFRVGVQLSKRVEPFTLRLAKQNAMLQPSALWLAEEAFAFAAHVLERWFTHFDLWLTPTLMRPPWRLGELDLAKKTDDEIEDVLMGYVGWLPLANATGVPGISLPSAPSDEGVPIGVHLVAAWGHELTLLDVAEAYEEARPWPRRAPFRS
ncbi:MAG: amidase family protein [Myxococcota bacterium]